jgi:hypothetical protein
MYQKACKGAARPEAGEPGAFLSWARTKLESTGSSSPPAMATTIISAVATTPFSSFHHHCEHLLAAFHVSGHGWDPGRSSTYSRDHPNAEQHLNAWEWVFLHPTPSHAQWLTCLMECRFRATHPRSEIQGAAWVSKPSVCDHTQDATQGTMKGLPLLLPQTRARHSTKMTCNSNCPQTAATSETITVSTVWGASFSQLSSMYIGDRVQKWLYDS